MSFKWPHKRGLYTLRESECESEIFLSTQVYYRISMLTRRTIEIAKNPLASDVAFAYGFA